MFTGLEKLGKSKLSQYVQIVCCRLDFKESNHGTLLYVMKLLLTNNIMSDLL